MYLHMSARTLCWKVDIFHEMVFGTFVEKIIAFSPLDSQVCSVDLYVCSLQVTILIWSSLFCGMFWSESLVFTIVLDC